MNRKIPFGACLVLALIAAIITYQMTVISEEEKYKELMSSITQMPSDNPKLSEVMYYTENYFVKDVDEEYLSDATIYGYVVGLGDQFSTYYTKEQYAEVTSSLRGNMTGIGIRVFLNSETSEMTVFEVMSGSPAEGAGVLRGDIIDSVNGIPYSELQYEGAYNELVGEADTSVSFSVKRGEEIFDFKVVRTQFEQQTVSYKICESDPAIGYIKIYSFDTATTNQFKNAVEKLLEMGAESLIFDVRNNPGGTLESISQILDYLLPEGPIIRMVSKSKETHELKSDAAELSVPMVVLADSSSASAAELFTSALMDYNKATFIGTKTYGKGTVQTNYPLSDGSALHISTQFYLPPYSDSFDGIGIVPDIEVELSEESQKNFYMLTEAEDEQLSAALDYLKQ